MAVETGIDTSGLDDFQKEMLKFIQDKLPKETYQFMRKAGTKGRAYIAKRSRAVIKRKTGNYQKGWKRGKAYKRGGTDSYEIQIRNSAPHAHLIEYGHRIVSKDGKDTEKFVPGVKVLEEGSKEFESEYFNMVEKFIDDVLDKGW